MRRWVSREQSNCLVRGCWRRQNSVVTKKKYISRPHTFTLERERLIGEIDHFEAKNVDVLWAHLGRRRAHLPSRSEFRDAEGRVGCGIATSTSLCTNMGKKRSQALGAGWWQKKHTEQHGTYVRTLVYVIRARIMRKLSSFTHYRETSSFVHQVKQKRWSYSEKPDSYSNTSNSFDVLLLYVP